MEALLELVRTRQPACGRVRVVAVDGPSGAGKSSLADALADRTDAVVVRTDEFVPGWTGLAQMPPALADGLLAPLARDETAWPPRWSWVRDTWVRALPVEPVPLLVLDGCGSGSRVLRPFLSVLVWVEADVATRQRRALSRDGDTYAPWWDVWAAQERRLFAAEGTRAAADLVVRTDDPAARSLS
ncbi:MULTISPECIES: (d)CMP kinase [Aeromicrobium]|uniref:Uncharacterized protein n=1 Tax=Aeromicrobium erythreum TaxID=2041 RepID=A0A0U3TES6_9ACTN|nr:MULTISPECIES: (d)CMP kinase [Aeromicrobium]ALX04007.1 hypothetical protein AERYTH_04475 [Aeromicrobium erythreum]